MTSLVLTAPLNIYQPTNQPTSFYSSFWTNNSFRIRPQFSTLRFKKPHRWYFL